MNSLSIFFEKFSFRILLIAQVFLFLLVKDDPFIGDSISTVSRAALNIYNADLKTIFYLAQDDPGHPTLIPYFLAFLWTIIGKKLWVGHFMTLIFSMGLLFQLKKLSFHFMDNSKGFYPLLIVFSLPGLISQEALVLTHLPLCFFFFWALNSLFDKNKITFSIALSLLLLTHLEGIFLASSLFLFFYVDEYSIHNKISIVVKKSIPYFIFSFLIFGLWLVIHYQQMNWWVSSPNYSDHRQISSLSGFFKNMLLIFWRIADYGYFILFIPFLFWKSKLTFSDNKKLYRLIYILSGILIFSIALFLGDSIAHRYFLPFSILLCFLFGKYLSTLRYNVLYLLLTLLFFIPFNFFYYPGKCLGDANILFRNNFEIESRIQNDFGKGIEVYTLPPISNSQESRYLEAIGINYKRFNNEPLDSIHFILENSFICNFPDSLRASLKSWKVKTYECGGVFAILYVNPIKSGIKFQESHRRPTKFEDLIKKLKRKFKN